MTAPEVAKHKRSKNAVGMATDFVFQFALHADGPTLRRWRGDWYRWTPDSGRYVCVTDERIEANLYQGLRMTSPADVRDVRSALIAVDGVLIDEVELGGWIGGPAIAFPSLELAVCPNGLLHLGSRALYPATPRYFATTSLGVNYERAAPSPARWLAFLRQLWPKDDQSSPRCRSGSATCSRRTHASRRSCSLSVPSAQVRGRSCAS